MRSALGCLAAVLLLAPAASSRAQMPGGPPPMMGPPAFLRQLFVPEQIMRYQDELGLSADQREAITREMADAQKKVVELQWQFESASKKLTDVLSAPRINETVAMTQADQVMNLEVQIKRTHLALLVRIKNLLTPDQQTKLTELVAKEPPRPGPGPPH